MRHLLTLKDEDLFTDAKNRMPEGWFKRTAARAVLFSEIGEVYLLKMSTRHYHKLPGGGVNEGESLETALSRELLEEIGCSAAIKGELGEIIEYRNREEMEQHSYCYIAKQSGPIGDTALEDGEVDDGAETVVAKNIDEAIMLLENDKPTNYEGHFIRQRDLRFLREAKRLS
jgi:ADP-ribose pyrophosphatase YjhB (NUDIX family)